VKRASIGLLHVLFSGNQKVLIDLSAYGQIGKKFAAGITTDKDDNIFITMLGCGKVLKFNAK
jgi:hypothetical protein